MLYAGLDLSRKRLDFHLLDAEGRRSTSVRRRPTPMDYVALASGSNVTANRSGRRSSR